MRYIFPQNCSQVFPQIFNFSTGKIKLSLGEKQKNKIIAEALLSGLLKTSTHSNQ